MKPSLIYESVLLVFNSSLLSMKWDITGLTVLTFQILIESTSRVYIVINEKSDHLKIKKA